MKRIAESVTYLHPDKICDQVSDLILDEYLKHDPYSRVAIETIGGHGNISIFGEVTSKADVKIEKLVQSYYHKLLKTDIKVNTFVTKQSPEIASGVNNGGAGDQGIMIGYACDENDAYLPQELYISRKLLSGVDVDGKSQVVLNGKKIESIVLSIQGKSKDELKKHIESLKIKTEKTELYLNNCGSFDMGGFDSDSGCTGRKIVVDAYGPRVPVGGGAFSGKDPTKVDRSAAYMARFIALQLIKKYGAKEVLVRLGYVIGGDKPVIQQALIDGKVKEISYDCRPLAIIERFNLRRPLYLKTARLGHFGFVGVNEWEKI